jgi:hypothetical protein
MNYWKYIKYGTTIVFLIVVLVAAGVSVMNEPSSQPTVAPQQQAPQQNQSKFNF